MDPLTAALNLANAALTFATKIFDATPAALKEQEAANWAKFVINIGNFVTGLQEQINRAGK